MEKVYGGKRNHDYPLNSKIISLIIVTRNADRDLQNCLDSITMQDYKNLEVLVFDGASTDGTLDIIRRNESCISYWQSEPDNGIYDAMNKAVKYATGNWIFFLGSDDKLLDGFSEMINKLKKEYCIYYGDYISNGKRFGGKFYSYRLAKANFCQQSVFYSKKVFEKYSFNESYPISADYLLNLECWADKKFNFEYHNIAIADFSSFGISSMQIDIALEVDRATFIKKYLGFGIYQRYRLRLLKNALMKLVNPYKKRD